MPSPSSRVRLSTLHMAPPQPLLLRAAEVSTTADPVVAFTNIDVCIMVGAMPRKQGMERKDLLKANAKIFETQGKALDAHAKKTVKVWSICVPLLSLTLKHRE